MSIFNRFVDVVVEPDAGAGDTISTPATVTGTYVTLGAAVAMGAGAVLLGGVIGWALRGDHEDKKRLGSASERRKLREERR